MLLDTSQLAEPPRDAEQIDELITQPITRRMIDDLLDAVHCERPELFRHG